MPWRKIGRTLLFPPAAVLILFLMLSSGGMIYTMVRPGCAAYLCIAVYALSFYTLVTVCARMPLIIRSICDFKKENKYIRTWLDDPRLRMNVTVSGSVLWNGAYGVLQLGLGVYHRSAWFYSLAAYYAVLAAIRFALVRYTLKHQLGENARQELMRYRTCGWVFLLMNLALSGMMFYRIYENRAVQHNEITTIAMATYTFTMLTVAIVNVVRYRKYNSPVLSAAKAISLAAACVSMLTLESTMLVSFNKGTMSQETIRIFLALSGGAISAFIVAMAIYMIVQANRKLKSLEVSHGK